MFPILAERERAVCDSAKQHRVGKPPLHGLKLRDTIQERENAGHRTDGRCDRLKGAVQRWGFACDDDEVR